MRSTLAGGRSSAEWVAEYEKGHTNPVNQLCHAFGIPMIAGSIPLFIVSFLVDGFWPVPVALFTIGWAFQFVGHAFEGKPPEFLKDPRFLFVGLRWWIARRLGRI